MHNQARIQPCRQQTPAVADMACDMPIRRQTTIVTVTYGDRLIYLRRLIRTGLCLRADHPRGGGQQRLPRTARTAHQPLARPGPHHPAEQNTGSANGYAVGLQAALEEGAEYLWMMDDDNAPTASAVRLLHEELARLGDEVGLQNAAVLGFRPSQQEDIARGVPRRFAIQPRSSYFGFHVAQLPYKLWRRLPWGRPKGTPPRAIDLPFAPTAACSRIAACTRRSVCRCANSCSTPTTPSTPPHHRHGRPSAAGHRCADRRAGAVVEHQGAHPHTSTRPSCSAIRTSAPTTPPATRPGSTPMCGRPRRGCTA